MESETYPQKKRTHNGHAVRQLRVDKRLSQEEFGKLTGMTQPSVCRYEEKEKIEEHILERMAKALEVSVDFIKEMEEDKSLSYYIENNTFTDNNVGMANNSTINNQSSQTLYTALEQMQKLYDSGMELYKNSLEAYQQVLKRTEEKIATFENKISELENKK